MAIPFSAFFSTLLELRQQAALDALIQMGKKKDLMTLVVLGLSRMVLKWWEGMKVAAARVEVTEKSGVELVPIPGGEFLMGSPSNEVGRFNDEGPQHHVKVSSFWLGRYPVTNEEYERFLKANPQISTPSYWGSRSLNQAQQPVVGVTWDEARAFAKWAGGRLPTEAEWEYACRAGTTTARYEEDLNAIAWYGERRGSGPHPVGLKKPNAWGLHDMLGNVWEWCSDGKRRYPERDALVTDPIGPDSGSRRVIRGGSWGGGARGVRAANRFARDPAFADGGLGLRLARSHRRASHAVPRAAESS